MSRLLVFLPLSLLACISPGWSQTTFALSDVKPQIVQVHRAKEAGLLETMEVQVGDKVIDGQVLARLEHDRQLHAYYVAKARAENKGNVTTAEGELMEKIAALEEMNMKFRRRQVSGSQVAQCEGLAKAAQGRLESARLNAELAELELRLSEKMLERRFVRCTLKGTVVEIARVPGDRVGEAEVVVTVADLNWMTALVPMTKESAAALAENAVFPIRLAGNTLTRAAQVISVSPMPNATKGEQMVQIAFANADPLSLVSSKVYEVLLPQNLKTAPVAKQTPPPPKPEATKKPPGRT